MYIYNVIQSNIVWYNCICININVYTSGVHYIYNCISPLPPLSHGCKCFDDFRTTINHLAIGNPDDFQNKLNSLKRDKIILKKDNDRLKSKLKQYESLSSLSPLSSSSDYNNGALDESALSSYESFM